MTTSQIVPFPPMEIKFTTADSIDKALETPGVGPLVQASQKTYQIINISEA